MVAWCFLTTDVSHFAATLLFQLLSPSKITHGKTLEGLLGNHEYLIDTVLISAVSIKV